MLKLAMVAVVAALISMIVKKQAPEYGTAIILCGSLFLMFGCIVYLQQLVVFIGQVTKVLSIDHTYLRIMLKLMGIAYVTEFAASICKDGGYQNLAFQVETAGKLAVLATSLPVIEALLQIISEMIS